MKIHKNDQVLIISGKDRGKTGKVLRAFPKKEAILVEGVNLKKKHIRPKREGEKGQVVHRSAPVPTSNAKLVCPKCKAITKVNYKVEKEKKYRICKKCNQEI